MIVFIVIFLAIASLNFFSPLLESAAGSSNARGVWQDNGSGGLECMGIGNECNIGDIMVY